MTTVIICRFIQTKYNLAMLLRQSLIRTNDLVKISVHKFICNINIIKCVSLRRWNNISDSHHLQQIRFAFNLITFIRTLPTLNSLKSLLWWQIIWLYGQKNSVSAKLKEDCSYLNKNCVELILPISCATSVADSAPFISPIFALYASY